MGEAAGIVIRDVVAADEPRWRELWAGYNDFYAARVPEAVTGATWHRLRTPGSEVIGRVAVSGGDPVGFANCVLHPSTWTTEVGCYLEDLFVDPAYRGRGVGRALICDLIELGHARGWSRLYWHTRAGNETARRLYDRFVLADDFVRYRLVFGRLE